MPLLRIYVRSLSSGPAKNRNALGHDAIHLGLEEKRLLPAKPAHGGLEEAASGLVRPLHIRVARPPVERPVRPDPVVPERAPEDQGHLLGRIEKDVPQV
jgi:hypothetical protein